jgi:secreted trypsin-like serine protease
MTALKVFVGPLGATLFAALVAAGVTIFAFAQGAEAAQVAEDRRFSGKVVGGTPVPDGKHEFVAALLDVNRGSTEYSQRFCGGALIDNDSILTAAHCVERKSASALRVTVGTAVLGSNRGQKRAVSEVFVHPEWDSYTTAYDAAVLELGRSVSGIAPVRLATARQDFLEAPGRNAKVAGWGDTIAQPADGSPSPGSNFPTRMREARVPIVSDASAERTYDPMFGPSGYIPAIQVAAGATGKDTCRGDSGGPMFAKPGGRLTQIGITSWGVGCGAPDFPGVYAEVNDPSIRGFIKNAAGN